MEDNSKRIS